MRGPTPSSKIGCIATLRKLNKKWPETVQTLLPMILEIYEGKLVQQQVLTGLVVLQRSLEVVKEPSLLTMRTTLEALGPYGLHKAAVPGKNGRAQKRGPLAYAKAILTELQTNFLAYPDFQLPG